MTVSKTPADIRRTKGRGPTVIAIFNQKGGIGKTTTTINLAVCLAAMGHKVVVVDLDSQSNATIGLGIATPPTRGAYELIAGTATLAEIRKPTAYTNLYVCGASDDLAGADIELAMADEPQRRLAQAIHTLPDEVDFVVVDCPPALGMLPVNALVACDWAILPVSPEPMARDGLAKAWRHIQRIRANLNEHLEVAGILLTMTSADELHGRMAETVRAEFGHRVLPVAIPYDPKVVEASAFDRPVVVHAADSPAAKAYLELARIIEARTRARVEAAANMLKPDELPGVEAVDLAPARAVLAAWAEKTGTSASASAHGGDPETAWLPPEAADAMVPAGAGARWRIGVALLLVVLGLLVGFVAGRSWG